MPPSPRTVIPPSHGTSGAKLRITVRNVTMDKAGRLYLTLTADGAVKMVRRRSILLAC